MNKYQKGRLGLFLFCIFIFLYLAIAQLSWIPSIFGEEPFVYKSQGRRDPMMPLITPQGLIRDIKSLGPHEGLSLEGIIYDAQSKSLAIINGQIVKAGDAIGEAKILDIRQDRVIILKDNEVQEIKLKEDE